MKSHCTWNLLTFPGENFFANRLGLFAIQWSQSLRSRWYFIVHKYPCKAEICGVGSWEQDPFVWGTQLWDSFCGALGSLTSAVLLEHCSILVFPMKSTWETQHLPYFKTRSICSYGFQLFQDQNVPQSQADQTLHLSQRWGRLTDDSPYPGIWVIFILVLFHFGNWHS